MVVKGAARPGAAGHPMIVDTFPFNNELDILECRLTEIGDVVDWFILVEATRDHQDHRKPLHYNNNQARFARWKSKIVHVIVRDGEMPSIEQDNDPWAREHAQREYIRRGLATLDLVDTDVIMQSDVDEIPKVMQVRTLAGMAKAGRLDRTIVFGQRGHFWCVDWLHPIVWQGTTAMSWRALRRLSTVTTWPYAHMRDQRMTAETPPGFGDAGWHLSWLGGAEVAMAKVGSFCHPEVRERIVAGLESDVFLRDGWHVDGEKMTPADVDQTWPKWIADGKAPAAWFRPR